MGTDITKDFELQLQGLFDTKNIMKSARALSTQQALCMEIPP